MAKSDGKAASGFEEHFRKLETFSQELQDNEVTIDELVPKMKDALQSLRVCKQVLMDTKSQLVEIGNEFSELENFQLQKK